MRRALILAAALSGCADRGAPPAAPPPAAPPIAQPVAKAPATPPPGASAVSSATLRFTDITEPSGIRFTQSSGRSGQRFYLEPHAGGCAAFDADGDGLTDLFAVDGGPLPGYEGPHQKPSRLFLARGDGTFEDATEKAGLSGRDYGFGAFPADYDGDGDDDLFVTNFGPDLLYRNNGDGTFTEVAATAGVAGAGWSTGAAWLDGDGDGDLDLYVVHYVVFDLAKNRECWANGVRNYCTPYGFEAEGDRYFENQGDGTFRDATAKAGVAPANGKGLGAVAHDLDGDGHPDVYVSNDETPNLYYRGLGGGRFQEAGLVSGLAVNAHGAVQAGMGIDVGDLDGDLRPDVMVANFQNEGIDDFRQLQPGAFTDLAARTGLGLESSRGLGFAVLLFDVDLDGDLDAFLANGHVWDNIAETQPLVTYGQRNLLGQNDGAGHFTEVSTQAGEVFQRADVTRSACLLDVDEDGDQDVFLVNLDAGALLLRNDTPREARHWIGLRLDGKAPNTQALGARLTVTAGGRTQALQNWRVRGYLSTSERTLRVGLGAAASAEVVDVIWPDGTAAHLTDLAADRIHAIDQASGRASPVRRDR